MRTPRVFAITTLLIIVSCAAPLVPSDKWAHGLVSACTASAGFWMALEAGADHGEAAVWGAGLSLYLGLVKEYSDCRAGRPFDLWDLTADAAGTIVGACAAAALMEE